MNPVRLQKTYQTYLGRLEAIAEFQDAILFLTVKWSLTG